MLNRFWQWTSQPAYAESGVCVGPLRFRAWTNGEVTEVPPTPPGPTVGVSANGLPYYPRRIKVPEHIQRDDEEIALFLASLLQSGILK